MKQQLLALIKPLVMIEAVILAGVALACFFTDRWSSMHDYSLGLMVVGGFLFTVGPFSLSFSGQNRLLPPNSRLYHTGQMDQLLRRSREAQPLVSTSLPRFTQLLMIDGALTFGVGLVLQAVVG